MSDFFQETSAHIRNTIARISNHDHSATTFVPPISWGLLASFYKDNAQLVTPNKFTEDIRKYLYRVKFFEHIGVEYSPAGYTCHKRDNIIELDTPRKPDDADIIAGKVGRLLIDYLPNRTDVLYENVRYIISELIGNIFHHSRRASSGFICGQYYPNSHILQIAIVDAGVGLKESLSHACVIESDLDAVKTSMRPGISGNNYASRSYGVGGPHNAGLGLTASKRIIQGNSGDFFLLSGNTLYAFEGKNDTDGYDGEFSEIPTPWKGTAIVFNFYTDRDQDSDYETVFKKLNKEIGLDEELFDF